MKKNLTLGLIMFIICLSSSLTVKAQGTIIIDHKTQRYVGHESKFNRSKYLTFHVWFKNKDADFEKFKKTYNIDSDYEGSRTFSSPLGKNKHGVFPNIKKIYSGVRKVNDFVATGRPNNIFYDSNVDYSSKDITSFVKKAAAYAVGYYSYQADVVPKYYEPFNEPMVKAVQFFPKGRKGKYNKDKINKIITKMCEFHRDLARAVHAAPELSNMIVMGFGSAFPEFEANNFELWKTRYKNFIDIAGKDMDAFSLHLYDGSGVNNKDGRRSGSNEEAILDMIETYSNKKLGKVKPFAITEYGRLVPDQKNYKETGNYIPVVNSQAVRSQLHMVMDFIERGDNLLLSTPFTVGKHKSKSRYSKSGMWKQNIDGTWELTPRKYFFEVWKDVKGDRVRINSTNIDVQTQAFVSGKQLYVVLNNLNDSTQTVNMKLLNSKGLNNVEIKRLKIFKDKTPELTNDRLKKAPVNISLQYGETVVLTYSFKSKIKFTNRIYSTKHYAAKYLQTIGANKKTDFIINNIKTGNGEATLRLSVGRKHGLALNPKVSINGNMLKIEKDVIKGYDQHNRKEFFGTLEIPVNMNYLNVGTNKISVVFPDAGGYITSVILQVQNADNKLKE